MTTQSILEEWYEAGFTPEFNYLPKEIQDKIAIKLFDSTPASGDKGMQDDILVEMFAVLDVKQLYALGFLPDAWIEEEYDNQLSIEENDKRAYKEFNE
jgi:hypothetical protein